MSVRSSRLGEAVPSPPIPESLRRTSKMMQPGQGVGVGGMGVGVVGGCVGVAVGASVGWGVVVGSAVGEGVVP